MSLNVYFGNAIEVLLIMESINLKDSLLMKEDDTPKFMSPF